MPPYLLICLFKICSFVFTDLVSKDHISLKISSEARRGYKSQYAGAGSNTVQSAVCGCDMCALKNGPASKLISLISGSICRAFTFMTCVHSDPASQGQARLGGKIDRHNIDFGVVLAYPNIMIMRLQ